MYGLSCQPGLELPFGGKDFKLQDRQGQVYHKLVGLHEWSRLASSKSVITFPPLPRT